MRSNRYVLDTNVWISYLITETYDLLINKVADGSITIFICSELIVELERVLAYPQLKKHEIDIRETIKLVKEISVNFQLDHPIKRYISADSDDDYIVALALQTNSGFITTGDKHILSEKSRLESRFKKLKILTKSEFEKKVLK